MGYSNNLDPLGEYAERQRLTARQAVLDAQIAAYVGDHNGLLDLKHQQIADAERLKVLPST